VLLLVQAMQKPYFLNKDKNFALYLGDSIELMNQFPPEHFDMIFADPPYNLSNGGFTVHAGKRVSVHKGDWDKSKGLEEDLYFHMKWIEACKRVLKPNGTIWISGTYHSIFKCGHALEVNGYHILNDIAWFKPNASPNLSGRYFTASHETLIWARKSKEAKHTFNYKLMREGEWHKTDFIKNAGKQMRSVWSIATPKPSEKKYGKHPTQKPVALLERIILASTNKGDVILDPFTGSSTTGIVAAVNGRKFIGIDLERKYLEISVKRFGDLHDRLGQ
jgi:site-specific DNA-methyltransferase (adenine-specific)